MAANTYDAALVQDAKKYALQILKLTEFKPEQSKAIDACINNFDTFISLPTGFGKSVVFQCVPLCHDYLQKHSGTRESEIQSLAIIILPLKALAIDQVKRAQALGIEAASMVNEVSDEVMINACQGKYSLLFSSPEVLLSSRGKELLQSTAVDCRLCGLFIDESHCVVKWGQSSGLTGAFRKFYGMLAELRSIAKLRTPITAMTATATQSVRGNIIDTLGMQNVVLINSNPVVANIKHIVLKTKQKNSDEIFKWLCDELTEKKEKCERIIIFCQSRKDCSELYSVFKSRLPQSHQKHFNMYHTNTENDIQREICDDFCFDDGHIRVLFATIAFGLGVDVKGVYNVVMYNPPQEIDDYIQLSGRGGRDGSQSLSVTVKTTKKTGRSLSKDMQEFINTKACRREVLSAAFPGDTSEQSIELHNCCDNCSLKCSCSGTGSCQSKLSHIEELLGKLQMTSGKEIPVISVTDEEYDRIKQDIFELKDQQLQLLPSEHIYSGTDVASDIPASTIDMILANLHIAFTYSQFSAQYALPNVDITDKIWAILVKHLGAKFQSSEVVQSLHSDDSSSEEDEELIEEELLLAQAEYEEPILHSSESD